MKVVLHQTTTEIGYLRSNVCCFVRNAEGMLYKLQDIKTPPTVMLGSMHEQLSHSQSFQFLSGRTTIVNHGIAAFP